MTVRTRFAPSPTGYLHIGGVRTALFNWLFARQNNGQFIIRIDDTDADRNVESALQPILDGFRWLGIDWDEGPEVDGPHAPYYQSKRGDRYQAAVDRLLAEGHAYRDYSGGDYQKLKEEAERAKQNFVYDRRWMAESDEQAAQFEAEGRSAVVRLKMPREGKCEFQDLIRGDVSVNWADEPDHVIQRANGGFIYHLANVVDDQDFEITHIVRAIEHLSNTPRQLFMIEKLGYTKPTYAHIPFVAEPGSQKKLSKRNIEKYLNNREFKKLYDHGVKIAKRIGIEEDPATFNPVLVDFYREVGYLPEAIINYLMLLGWSLDDKTEDFTIDEMIQHFSFERVVKNPASFDPNKLSAFQERKMAEVPGKQKVAKILPFLQAAGLLNEPVDCDAAPYLSAIVEAAEDRIKVAGDILNFDDFFASDNHLEYDEKAFNKRLVKPENATHLLAEFKKILAATDDFSAANLELVLHQFVEHAEIKIGDIIHALRVAVTGKAAGFGMFDTMAIVGKENCLERIDRAIDAVAAVANES